METICPFCKTNVDAFAFNHHIPKCYHQSCVANEEVPLCTCLTCKGTKTHDGDHLHKIQNATTVSKRKSLTAPVTLESISQTQSSTSSEDVSPQLHPNKLSGKECICCNVRTAAKGFPKIYV
uniref:Uncharacterized protein n=1 Tax=Naegleria fowleri TaxID=5763 RepID=M1H5V9_NAEFO|nr:hypothetical protein [Naegleria fowleri]